MNVTVGLIDELVVVLDGALADRLALLELDLEVPQRVAVLARRAELAPEAAHLGLALAQRLGTRVHGEALLDFVAEGDAAFVFGSTAREAMRSASFLRP